MNLRKIAANNFVRGGFLFTFINIFVGFLSYLFNSVSAKMLGPRSYSELAAFTSYTIVMAIPVLTLTTDIVRRIGAMKKAQVETVANWERSMYQWFGKYKYLLPLLFVVAYIINRSANIQYSTALVLVAVSVLAICWGFYLAAFQALHWFEYYALLMLMVSAIRLIGPFVPLPHTSRLEGILYFVLLGNVMTVALGAYLLRRKSTFTIAKNSATRLLRHRLANRVLILTMFSLVAMNLMNNLDIMVARRLMSSYDSGLYAAWSLFAKIIFYLTAPLINLSLIFFSSHKYKKHHGITVVVVTATLMAIGATLYVTYSLIGRILILLIFTHEYLSILKWLPLAGIFGVVYSGIYFFNNFFLSRASKYSLIGVGALPAYAALLIAYGHRVYGIIMVNIIMSCAVFVCYIAAIFYYNKHRWNLKKTKSTS